MKRLSLVLALVALVGERASAQGVTADQVLGQDRLVTVREAVALALENNLGLQVIRIDPALAREDVRATEGYYEPSAVAYYDRQHLETPLASSVQRFFGTAGTRTTEDYYVYNAGVVGVLPWGIGYSSGYTYQILESDSSFFALAPQYTATWRSELVIPLLRGLYWNKTDLDVRQSLVLEDRSNENFRANLTDTVAGVEAAYWALTAARALEDASVQSVETARDLVGQTKVQYQVGVVSRVRVTEAESILSQREFDQILRSNAAQAAQDDLLTAILAPGLTDYSTTRIQTENPAFVPYDVSAEVALDKARAARPELERARKDVESAELSERFFWNQKLPALDVRATYANGGLAGTQKTPAGTFIGFSDDPTTPGADPIPGQFPDLGFQENRWSADDDFFDASGEHSWGVRAALTVPIGNDTADARHVQSRIRLRQAKTALRIEEQRVVVNVRDAVRNLESAIDGVTSAKHGRTLAEETLRAEQERLRLGDSTPHDVSEFQDVLLTAQSNEIRALQVYRTAISALERAQGTLLDRLGIDVEDERGRGLEDY